jgi:ribonuclease VapC
LLPHSVSDRCVLDSYALLAYLRGEDGGERVRDLLEASAAGAVLLMLSLVNYGEIAYMVERKAGAHVVERVLALVDQLPVDIVAPDRALTLAAARLKAAHPISYADAFAAALAQTHGAAVLTGDPEFRTVADIITVEWLPASP